MAKPGEILRETVRKLARKLGYEITRRSSAPVGFNKFTDIGRLLAGKPKPVIFDVGSNVGLTVIAFKNLLPQSVIHAFEPSPETFRELKRRLAAYGDVVANDLALGSATETKVFLENSETHMSSFLQPDQECWGKVAKQTQVQITKLDDYCATKKIKELDLLKIDAQGFDLEVLKGARQMMQSGGVPLILIELTFARHYQHAPTMDEIYRFLTDHRYRLMALYEIQYRNGMAHWCDALFVHEDSRHLCESPSRPGA